MQERKLEVEVWRWWGLQRGWGGGKGNLIMLPFQGFSH